MDPDRASTTSLAPLSQHGRHVSPQPPQLRQRGLNRAATFADSTMPSARRRSSVFSEGLSETRKSILSSTDDLLVPRYRSGSAHAGQHEPSHWHSIPLGLALLPAFGGLFFQNGSAVITDMTLLALAAIFLNWSVRLPWDWYFSAQTTRQDDSASLSACDTIQECSDEDGEDEPGASSQENNASSKPGESVNTTGPNPQADLATAQKELRIHELLALSACFLFPVVGAWLLHAIRSQLSRPSEGLVSNYNLTVFLLASEIRPLSHLVKMVQARTLHLQRVVGSGVIDNNKIDTSKLLDMAKRLEELEAHVADTADKAQNMIDGPSDPSPAKAVAQASSDLRKTIQPELDALTRAVRRYEKRTTISTLQTEARLQELESRLKDVVVLAAAAQRNAESVPRNFILILINWLCGAIVLPVEYIGFLIGLPSRTIHPQDILSTCVPELTSTTIPRSNRLLDRCAYKPAPDCSASMSGAVQAQRGRSGKKWVGLNYDEKERAKDANAGTMPYTLSLVTSDFPHKAEWSQDNLPEILFYIHPPRSRYVGARVVDLIEIGQPVASGAADGHNIRDYEILPRNISLEVPGWLIEAWRRLDPRIGYQDILDRQYADPKLGLKKHTKNALQNHCRRECRRVLNTWVEYGRRDEPHRTEVESIERLTPDNIKFNTTLNRSIVLPNRLVKVRLERRVDDGLYYAVPRDVTQENWRETTLPLDHFLPNGQNCQMTQEMHAALEMYLKLTERAKEHGLSHWSKLDRGCLPVSWYDRTRTKSVPNDTYDGGCAICTWTPGKKDPVGPEIEIKQEVSPRPNAGKRRRADGRAKRSDIDDIVSKASKRRLTTRRSAPRPETPSEGSDDAGSSGPEGYTYVETYGRTEDEYEYYTVAPQSASLRNDDTEHEGSQHETSGQEEEGQGDETNPDTNAKSVSSEPDDEEEASGVVEQVETHDLFSTPSGRPISRPKGSRKSKIVADGSSVRSQQSTQAGCRLRTSDFLQSDPFSQDIDQGSNSSVENVMPLVSKPNEVPGYLPASVFLSRQSSFASDTAPSGPSFSSNNATLGANASSYVEASHTAIGDYHHLPTVTATGFPANHFYPTLMMQSQLAFHNPTYVSPPETVVHQNHLSFMSSPPRRPEPEWGWNQDRQRRHSETDATVGLGLNLPSDLAGLGAFTYGSAYVADAEVGNGLELQPTVEDNEFAYANPFESNEPEIGEIATSGDGEYAGMVVDQNMDHYNDRELFGNETTGTMAPFEFVEV